MRANRGGNNRAAWLLVAALAWGTVGPLAVATEAAGRRYALVIGIEAYPEGALAGCALDAKRFRQALVERLGFAEGEVAMLLDRAATRAGILAGLEAALGRAKRGDLFVLYYSGHGSVFPDRLSEEQDETQVITPTDGRGNAMTTDRYDVALCPVDVGQQTSGKQWGNLILDDELYAIFSRFAAQGAQVVFVSDSCFSGTLARGFGDEEVVPKFLPPGRFQKAMPERSGNAAPAALSQKAPEMRGRYLTFGSSTDEQTSGATKNGSLFTLALLTVLEKNPRLSYRQVYGQVRELVLRLSKREQEPRLDTRFFSGSVDEPFLASPPGEASEPAPGPSTRPLAIGVMVTDLANRPLPRTALGIFPAGTDTRAGRIRVGMALLQGLTDEKGIFRSTETLAPGRYRIKAVHKTHRAFESDVEIRESRSVAGASLLYVRLVPEGQ
ncbi:MAG: caspase family protein [Blastocatellia bacterium]|nr:caspase family protein [Blastocatellia bacterium]